jgi:hypothetical protein
MRRTIMRLAVATALALTTGAGHAQWTTQTVPLRPGWNAVHLQVQPEPADCDTLLAGLPVESVWLWNRRHAPVQFIQDPATLTPTNADWLIYLPPAHPRSEQTTLFRLLAGKCYLIKIANTAGPINWVVLGRPVTARAVWLTDSFNLSGLAVDLQSPPTFRSFFGPSPAHSSSTFYRLRTDGYWEQVPLPNTTRMTNGQAWWLKTQGASTYQGPVQLTLEQATGLDFGRVLNEQLLVIHNAGTNAKTLVIRQLPSALPPAGAGTPPLAGDVPLSYWFSSATTPGHWTNLPSVLMRSNVPAGDEWRLRLAVRRKDMPPAANGDIAVEPLYQSLLEVTEAAGSSRHLVPVSAYGLERPAVVNSARGELRAQGDSITNRHRGLWIGSAVINQVNQPALAGNSQTPLPTASEFQFRLILHVDNYGKVRLLQKVLQMWKTGTYQPDPQDPTKQVADEPGRFVLLTDERLASAYSGATLRDGKPVGRRFSSAAFSFRQPLSLSSGGDFGVEGSVFSCTASVDYRDALNPFVHRYHPDHDNLNESYSSTLEAGRESPTITRQITLQFTAEDPDRLQLAGWGSSQLGGIYRETILGLHKAPLRVEGTFRIHLASNVAQLNDGLFQ